MAEETEITSTTVFNVADKASGPISDLAKSTNALNVAAEKAKQSVKGLPGAVGAAPVGAPPAGAPPTPPAPPAGPKKPPIDPEIAARRAEREKYAVDKEEMALRHARMRRSRMGEAQEETLRAAVGVGMAMMGGETKTFVGQLGRAGDMAQMVGFRFGAMGGETAAFGEKLAAVGSMVGTMGTAFELGYTAGMKLVEATTWLATTYLGWEDDVTFARHENDRLAASLGYAGSAAFATAFTMQETGKKNQKFARLLDEQANQLGALPTGKTGQAMADYTDHLIQVYRQAGLTGKEAVEYAPMLAEAGAKNAASLSVAASRQTYLNNLMDEMAAKYEALPLSATQAEIERQNDVLRWHIVGLQENGTISREEATTAWAGVQTKIEHNGSLAESTEAAKREILIKAELEKAQKEALKTINIGSKANVTGANATIALANRMYEIALPRLEKMGVKVAPGELGKRVSAAAVSHATQKWENHFHNPRFDIKQAFAEGYDPERIAVAFTSELSKAANYRTGSAHIVPGVSG